MVNFRSVHLRVLHLHVLNIIYYTWLLECASLRFSFELIVCEREKEVTDVRLCQFRAEIENMNIGDETGVRNSLGKLSESQ